MRTAGWGRQSWSSLSARRRARVQREGNTRRTEHARVGADSGRPRRQLERRKVVARQGSATWRLCVSSHSTGREEEGGNVDAQRAVEDDPEDAGDERRVHCPPGRRRRARVLHRVRTREQREGEERRARRAEALDKQARADRVDARTLGAWGRRARPGTKMQDPSFYGTKRMRLGTSRR